MASVYTRVEHILQQHHCDLWGICDFESIRKYQIDCAGIKKLPDQAKSIICILYPYYVDDTHPNISRYSVVPDYHTIINRSLASLSAIFNQVFKNNIFTCFCDNSPIPEVRASVLAGLGVLGKNNLLIHPIYGSWVFIGTIVTDLDLNQEIKSTKPFFENECLGCNQCITSCPGGALSLSKNINGVPDFKKAHCLSHITQKKGLLTPWEETLIQKNKSAWGCDICQTVCPMNHKAKRTNISEFIDGAISVIDEDTAKSHPDRAYLWRGNAVILRNLRLLKES